MAYVWACGFECLDNPAYFNNGVEGKLSGTTPPTYDSSIKRSGAYSIKIAPGTTSGYWVGGPHGDYYSFYLRVTSLPASGQGYLLGYSSGYALRLNSSGTIGVYNSGSLVGTSTTALTDSAKWYKIDYRYANGTSVPVLRIDNTTQVTASPSGWAFQPYFGAYTGGVAYTAYVDDLVGCSSDFTSDDYKVILLLPISDNSRTDWTAGAGGTSNLYEAINNTPPAGLASASETNTSNIECASKTTNSYAVNLTTYTDGGIGASDTIKFVLGLLSHGEDISTGTKNVTISVSNPTISGVGIVLGGDAGAHGPYADVLTKWATSDNDLSASDPSVTKGSSPVITLTKTDGTTRVACFDFVGLVVVYVAVSGETKYQSCDGTVALTATLAFKPNKALAGSTAATGALTKSVAKPGLAGAVALAGALAKKLPRSYAGAVAPTGILTAALLKLLSVAGAVAPTGALVKKVAKALAGAVSPTATFSRLVTAYRAFEGVVGPTATLAAIRTALVAIAGAVAPTGALAKTLPRAFSGAVALTGALGKQAKKGFDGTVALAGALTKSVAKGFSGAVTLTGALVAAKGALISLAGAVAPVGTLVKQFPRAFSGTVALTGALAKQLPRAFAGAVAATGVLDIAKALGLSVAGVVGPSGSLTKQVRITLAGSVTISGELVKKVAKILEGIVIAVGEGNYEKTASYLAVWGVRQPFVIGGGHV